MTKKNILTIKVVDHAGNFAENKDVARRLREQEILPTLKTGGVIMLDYTNVSNTTQSFTHALISEAIRQYGIDILDKIHFKQCNESVKRIISIVVEYMQGNMNNPIS